MVKGRLIALLSAALLVVGLLAGPGIAEFSGDDSDTRSSYAEISVVDCVVESSKDISYVAFLDGGEELDKFNVNETTYDLTGYDSIDDVDSVRVKSGQTVESFGVSDCGDTTNTDGDDTTGDDAKDDEDDDDVKDDDVKDEGDTTGDDVTQPDSVENHNDKASPNSQATITLSGCTVDSSKEISYVAFFGDGEQLDKVEDVDSESYDLAGYEGIDDVDSVRVKAGTTVATFSVACGDGTAGTDDEAKDDETKDDESKDEDSDHDDTAGTDGDTTKDEEDDDDSDDDTTWDDHEGDDAKEEDDSDEFEDDSDDDDSDDTETDDAEWDARHDGRHDHTDHEEIEREDA